MWVFPIVKMKEILKTLFFTKLVIVDFPPKTALCDKIKEVPKLPQKNNALKFNIFSFHSYPIRLFWQSPKCSRRWRNLNVTFVRKIVNLFGITSINDNHSKKKFFSASRKKVFLVWLWINKLERCWNLTENGRKLLYWFRSETPSSRTFH